MSCLLLADEGGRAPDLDHGHAGARFDDRLLIVGPSRPDLALELHRPGIGTHRLEDGRLPADQRGGSRLRGERRAQVRLGDRAQGEQEDGRGHEEGHERERGPEPERGDEGRHERAAGERREEEAEREDLPHREQRGQDHPDDPFVHAESLFRPAGLRWRSSSGRRHSARPDFAGARPWAMSQECTNPLQHVVGEPGREALPRTAQVPADRCARQVDHRAGDRLDGSAVRAPVQGTGDAGERALEGRVDRVDAGAERLVGCGVEQVAPAQDEQQPGVVGVVVGEVERRPRHRDRGLDGVVGMLAVGGHDGVREPLESAQPGGGEDPVAAAEPVVEGAGRGAAGLRDRGDRDAARPPLEREPARGVEDRVGRVLAWWSHI
ncbi:MAG: hypothetical protein AVDCRST_MAG30-1312 [uncultured Solirubrobacteraceae bacterium]|uniref:Uncharacterized protein n=1 Tax=uncultured Solirubrobacteraceae bacterium TaxID=1162706 RepID=A0A6J4S5E3_9ACTN|nr:MAG: hypothetical protein AVDCRST_MAG30-1312 [uncultured Solirubrobacteraceae bacterium]